MSDKALAKAAKKLNQKTVDNLLEHCKSKKNLTNCIKKITRKEVTQSQVAAFLSDEGIDTAGLFATQKALGRASNDDIKGLLVQLLNKYEDFWKGSHSSSSDSSSSSSSSSSSDDSGDEIKKKPKPKTRYGVFKKPGLGKKKGGVDVDVGLKKPDVDVDVDIKPKKHYDVKKGVDVPDVDVDVDVDLKAPKVKGKLGFGGIGGKIKKSLPDLDVDVDVPDVDVDVDAPDVDVDVDLKKPKKHYGVIKKPSLKKPDVDVDVDIKPKKTL